MRVGPILPTVGWGLYCATSWTWCIGMYLPLLLVERFGWAGFIAFALPNVLGCTMFGYIIRTPRRSEAFLRRHEVMLAMFSVVAIAYHMFFVCLIGKLFYLHGVLTAPVAFTVPLIIYAVALAAATTSRRRSLIIAGTAGYFISLILLLVIGVDQLADIRTSGSHPASELAWLVPVLCFGFLLCPYFDLTFHRALHRSPSRHSFLVFGVSFAVMILLTLVYWSNPSGLLAGLAGVHILLQSALTCAFHMRELGASRYLVERKIRHITFAVPLLGAALGASIFFMDDLTEMGTFFNRTYLRFLVFFALVFPGYAIVFMHPGWAPRRSTRNLILFAAALIAMMPFFEIGFIGSRMSLLAVPIAVAIAWIIYAFVRSGGPATTSRDREGAEQRMSNARRLP